MLFNVVPVRKISKILADILHPNLALPFYLTDHTSLLLFMFCAISSVVACYSYVKWGHNLCV